VRATKSTAAVATVLLNAPPNTQHWGYHIGKTTGVPSGVLYPILRRMLDAGWVTDGWEHPHETLGRPPRRYYQVSADGRGALAAIVERAKPTS
jgi:PadR family transcriptional regulator PadR